MSEKPLISVIMPAHNAGSYIAGAIESILAQSFVNFELIIIDDGSSDTTGRIAVDYASRDSRIKILVNQDNRGVSSSRNRGLEVAEGQYIAWQDADDIAMPSRLKLQLDFLDTHPEVGMVGGSLEFFDDTGTKSQRDYETEDAKLRAKLFRYQAVSQPAGMVRKVCFATAGLFDESLETAEDLDMTFRIARTWKLANIPEVVIKYRMNTSSLTYKRLKNLEQNTFRIRAKYKGDPAFNYSFGDIFYNILQRLSLHLMPPGFRIWLFSKLRNKKAASQKIVFACHSYYRDAGLIIDSHRNLTFTFLDRYYPNNYSVLRHSLYTGGESRVYKQGTEGPYWTIPIIGKLPSFLRYVAEVKINLLYLLVRLVRHKITLIAIDPLSAFAGVLLKRLGFSVRVIFITPDFARERFQNKVLNRLYFKLDEFCTRYADINYCSAQTVISFKKELYGPKIAGKLEHLPNSPAPWLVEPLRAVAKIPYRCVYVGDIGQQLDFKMIFSCVEQLKAEFPEICLRIIGDGEKRVELEAWVKEQGYTTIQFLGHKPYGQALAEIATATVGLALYNGQLNFDEFRDSIKVREYQALGVIPIASKTATATANEIALYGSGVVIENTAEDLSETLRTIFSDRETQVEMMRACLRNYRVYQNTFEKLHQTVEVLQKTTVTPSLEKAPMFWNLLAIGLNMVAVGFLFFTQLKVSSGHNLFGLIDQGFMELNPAFHLARNLFAWDSTRGLGESQFLFMPSGLAEAFYVYLLSWIAPNFSVLSFLKLFVLQLAYYAGGFISLVTFVKYVLKKPLTAQMLSVVSMFSLLGILNLHFFQSSAAFLFNQRYDLFIFSLLFYSLSKIVHEKKGYILFILASLLSIGCWTYIGFWLPFVLFLIAYAVLVIRKYKVLIALALLHFVLILPAIVPLALFYSQVNPVANTAISYKDVIFDYANRNSTLNHITALIGGVNWDLAWGWLPGALAYPYVSLFGQWPAGLLAMGIFLVFLVGQLFLKQVPKSVVLWLNGTVITSIFLIASYNKPFGKLFVWLLNNAPLFIVFRESHNKVYPVLILALLLVGLTGFIYASGKVKKALAVFLAVYCSVFLYAGLHYGIFSQQGAFTFPAQTYQNLTASVPEGSSVLWLPEYSYAQRYSYGYAGNTITRYALPFRQFDISYLLESGFHNPLTRSVLDNFNYEIYPKGLYNFGLQQPSFDGSLLEKAGIQYVIFDKQLIGDTSIVPFTQSASYLEKLRSVPNLEVIVDDNNFVVFKNKTISPVLFAKNSQVSQKSPVEYQVLIKGLTEATDLTFLEGFDKGWATAFVPIKTDFDCDIFVEFSVQGVKVCKNENSSTSFLTTLRHSFSHDFLSGSHIRFDEYANRWRLDPEALKTQLPESDWQSNPDGGIDVLVVVYFKPQGYYYASWVVAILSALGIFGWLGYRKFSSRTLNSHQKQV